MLSRHGRQVLGNAGCATPSSCRFDHHRDMAFRPSTTSDRGDQRIAAADERPPPAA